MSSVKKVTNTFHNDSKKAKGWKSCDHSSPDCPHGTIEGEGNIPWASNTGKELPANSNPSQEENTRGSVVCIHSFIA